MKPAPVLTICPLALALLAPAAAAQKVADFDWAIDALLVSTGEPMPPIGITEASMFVSEDRDPEITEPTMGRGDLVLMDGQSGSIDYTAASDPDWYAYFVSLFQDTSDEFNDLWIDATLIDPTLGSTTVDDLTGSPDAPVLNSRLSAGEVTALDGADIQFFRLIVDDVSIVNGYQGMDEWSKFDASGTFEVWVPGPGVGAVLVGLPLAAGRRRL